MNSTGGFRRNFRSNTHYDYFSGNGFNLRQHIYTFSAASPEMDFQSPRSEDQLSPEHFHDRQRKRSSSCPMPTPKKRFEDNRVTSPVVDTFPDSKLDFKGTDLPTIENLDILVTGPVHCGKARFVEAMAKSNFQVLAEGGPNHAFKQSFTLFNIKVRANVWYMKSPKDCTKSLKDEFSGKNLAIILVYDVTVPKTLYDVRGHILGFRRVLGVDVPIILVGNKTDMRTLIINELSMLDWGLLGTSDGQQVKEEYKLAAFIECSGETGHGMDNMLFNVSTVALGDYFKF